MKGFDIPPSIVIREFDPSQEPLSHEAAARLIARVITGEQGYEEVWDDLPAEHNLGAFDQGQLVGIAVLEEPLAGGAHC